MNGCYEGTSGVDIDAETRKILLRSRQATSRPSPEPSPQASPDTTPLGSMEDLTAIADNKKDLGGLDREIHLQEIDPETYLSFGSEVWR